jgi:hypothetical protein
MMEPVNLELTKPGAKMVKTCAIVEGLCGGVVMGISFGIAWGLVCPWVAWVNVVLIVVFVETQQLRTRHQAAVEAVAWECVGAGLIAGAIDRVVFHRRCIELDAAAWARSFKFIVITTIVMAVAATFLAWLRLFHRG